MKQLTLWAAIAAIVWTIPGYADVIVFKDGRRLEGVIKKVEKGQVIVEVDNQTQTLDIPDIASMDFDTPHLTASRDIPVEHFLKNVEAQEVVKNIQELEKSADEIRRMLAQINAYWKARQPVPSRDVAQWESAKETFRRPLGRYQELLNDLYFHVLARVDEYNGLMQEATKVYVGVKGVFNVGSPLVPSEYRNLPLKKYVPGAWYDTIYYQGYNVGYDDAYIKYVPRP